MSKLFYARMIAGKPQMEDPTGFDVAKRALEGKRVSIRLAEAPEMDDIEKLRAFFHCVVVPEVARGVGYSCTKEELKRAKDGLKERFLTDPATGDVLSTESLKPAQYAAFIDECIQFAAETLGVVIRDLR